MTGHAIPDTLEGHDKSQSEFMAENCILVDADDRAIGSASKMDCHIGDGIRHRAFSVLLYDHQGRLLVQRRSQQKITFPGVWANSCCSHPLDIEGENGDPVVGVMAAARRKLVQEMGYAASTVEELQFEHIGSFEYNCRWDPQWIEHEIDHVLVARTDTEPRPNPNEISEVLWVDPTELKAMVTGKGDWQNRDVAPWFKMIWEHFMESEHPQVPTAPGHASIIRCGELRMDVVPGQFLLDALSSHREIVEGVIMSSLGKMKQERLHGAMTHLFSGGGKRLRAIIPRLVGDAVGEGHDGHYTLGACIEIIHNFTLVHDDIMDQDPIRRGLDAVHVAYDDATAINAGDAMLAVGFEILAETPHIDHESLAFLVKSIGEMVRMVAEGQMVDIEFEERDDVSEEDYIAMIAGKTSAMFETCAMTGAKLAGADDSVVDNMANWGMNLGLCFQMMDDLIDVTGDTETLGKPAGSDIVQGKRTLIAIHALRNDLKMPMFSKVFGSGDCSKLELAEAVEELRASGSIDYAKQRAMEHHSIAHACLDKLKGGPAVDVLRELTDFQLIRIN